MWNIVFFEEGILMDFVSADGYGLRVVDYFHSQFPSSFGDNISRIKRVSRCPNENGVIFGDIRDVFPEKETELIARLLRGKLEVVKSAFLAGIRKIVFLNKTRDLRHRRVHPAQK